VAKIFEDFQLEGVSSKLFQNCQLISGLTLQLVSVFHFLVSLGIRLRNSLGEVHIVVHTGKIVCRR